ncbi:MAG TPA: protein kinase [Solirubrobacteraceae bacterium]|nr:protein kinase [Solirubrobacteraceae bacterium]
MLRAPDLAGCALEDRYELHAVIGEGAFGRVYRGVDRRLDRSVAVKVIKPWWAEDGAWVERFQREAQLLARVNDPGIVQIFDFGHAEQGPYYVAELVDGESLAERLRRGPLPVAQARDVAEQLCRALGSAHAQGVVHCDVKPANVLLTAGGRVKVGDFGVARFGEGTSQPLSATVAGTPRYMSPEQADGRAPTPATDVYSAGVVLYEMLAGEPPFAGRSAIELGIRHLQEPPPALPAEVPAAIAEVVEKALAKRPQARYRDGAGMAAALSAPSGANARGGADDSDAKDDGCADDGDAVADIGATDDGDAAHEAAGGELGEPATIDLAAGTTVVAAAPTDVLVRAPVARQRSPRAPQPRRQRHAPLRARTAVLLALAVGAICALAVFALAGASAHTTVPELRGIRRGGVIARAQRTHVQPAFSSRYAEAPAGVSIAQSPAAGTHTTEGATVDVVLSAGPPPVTVPDVVGQASGAAEGVLSGTGLRYGVTFVPAPGSPAYTVLAQSPGAGASVPHRTAVALSIAEAPQWRPLTSFSGVDDGESVPFRIRGNQWRVTYSMGYEGTCLLLLLCGGPSAEAENVQRGAGFGGFELGEGSSQSEVFHSGPGTYRVKVSGGRDSAHWSMTVDDYY